MEIQKQLPSKFNLAVCLNKDGMLAIQIGSEFLDPVRFGHQCIRDRHSSWVLVHPSIIPLIESALQNKNKWVWN